MGANDTDVGTGGMITVTEAAKRLNAAPRTVRQWIDQGRLRGEHVNPRLILVDADTVEALRTMRNRVDRPYVGLDSDRRPRRWG